MAAASNAKRKRTQANTDDDFEIPMADALAKLLKPQHVQDGDTWYFQVMGDTLRITRTRSVVTIPDPDS
jgi:hypothetical protein